MQQFIKILLFPIYVKLDMFRATHRHHQEPKTALAASGFAYVGVEYETFSYST
jgi:hypothetical protein